MHVFRIILLVFQALVVSRLACGASIDRYESAKPGQTTVIDLRRSQSESVAEGITEYVHYDEEDDYYGNEDEEQEYEDYASGVDEVYLPKVAHSSKPKDPTAILEAARNNVTKSRGLGRKRSKGKGKGKKRDPCLRKYKSFCIHGTCRYHKELRTPTCVCNAGYIGERCHTLSLPVGTNPGNYDRTTALAVMAVVLSSLCLTIIAILLAIRYHKRGAYDVENEEKVKLGTVPQH
ncbi:proheparin-binding EGF-like growth factor [Scleropages formosus]|uniref:Proheparin-binding EGF-like growth factor n=1 Tax=Scleropages formosus TaxID=113540 RepID=A0A8C9RYT8_SCLFO|nr:proheparin-binding EGF-like growth factor [Scleropages formosus]